MSLNKFILGTVQMGLPYGINNSIGKISLNNSINILEYAFNQGIRVLDSAESYGNAHEVIGRFHKTHPDKIFEIITKLPHKFNDKIEDKVNDYLSNLNVKQLYGLLFHSYSSYKDDVDNFKSLIDLKAKGKIKYIGVSVYTNEEIKEVLLNDEINVIQLPFNLLDNSNLRKETLLKAKSKGKIIHTRSALLQGLFFKDIKDNNSVVQSLKEELLLLSNISRNNNISISKLALSYCIHQQYIDNVLIGVDSLNQLIDNIKSLDYQIDVKTVNEINLIKIQDLDLLNPSLWR